MRILTFESFSPHLNSTFALGLGESTVELTLTQATKQPVHSFPGMMREPFSLIFHSGHQVVLPQRLYPLKHESLGKLEIFIVPVARDPRGVVYQAVFN